MAVLCLPAGKPAEAQENNPPLQQAIALFDEGEWEQAIDILDGLLNAGELPRDERSRVRKFIGLGHILLGQEEKAVAVFKDIVREDRAFDMNALARGLAGRPTEAFRLFGQAVLEVRQEEIEAREAQLRLTSRRGALLRSAVLPGWGQRYLGYRNRGYMMLGLAVASISYAAIAEGDYRSARDGYNRATAGADFDRLLNDYATRADRADLALGIVAAVWVLNMVDAATQGPNITVRSSGLALRQRPADNGLRVVFWRRF